MTVATIFIILLNLACGVGNLALFNNLALGGLNIFFVGLLLGQLVTMKAAE